MQFLSRGLDSEIYLINSSARPISEARLRLFPFPRSAQFFFLFYFFPAKRMTTFGVAAEAKQVGGGTTVPFAISSPRHRAELTKGFTPRHYFRHNIRPVHTIKQ